MSWFSFIVFVLVWCSLSGSIAQEETQIYFGGLPMPVSFPFECLPSEDMIDASGKIPAGINSGNFIELGAFDQCIGIKESVINSEEIVKGKYCIMEIVLNNKKANKFVSERDEKDLNKVNNLLIGWCFPNTCNMSMVENIFKLVGIEVTPVLEELTCQTEDDVAKELDESDLVVIGFFTTVLVVIVLSTIYDIYLHFVQKRPAHFLFVAFSVKTNSEKLLRINKSGDNFPCLDGIRFISTMWIVLLHRYNTSFNENIINPFEVRDWAFNDAVHMIIINGDVAVDTFLVLSGLLVCYGFCLAKNKKVHFNIPMFYVHRYIRLTPVFGVIILIHATILPHLGSGPLWPQNVFALKDSCVKYWWTSLIYVQNYYDTKCLMQTWYLSVDFQLYILSPIILLPLWKWPKHIMIASALLVVGSIISSFVASYYFELPANVFDLTNRHQYFQNYYFSTHTRFGPWLMGFMLGYYLFKLKKDSQNCIQYQLGGTQIILGWAIALAIMLACLFGSYHFIGNQNNLSNSFWNGFHRHGWALGLCWVIFACTQGYGGVINSFLSCPAFQILGRFTYTIYLVHLPIQILVSSASRTNHYFEDFTAMHLFWGDFFLSLGISIILNLAVGSPMMTLEKLISSKEGKMKNEDHIPNVHEPNNN